MTFFAATAARDSTRTNLSEEAALHGASVNSDGKLRFIGIVGQFCVS
jgi:hypothetical protein